MKPRRTDRRQYALGALCGLVLALAPQVAGAHGDRTGVADLVVDYGLPAFVVLMVLLAVAVILWLSLRPPPEPTDGEATDTPAESEHQGNRILALSFPSFLRKRESSAGKHRGGP